MKNPIHKSIRAVALLLLSLATMVSAGQLSLQTDAQTGEKYVNMPAGRLNSLDILTDTLIVPSNVTTFKVYDDGGKDLGYSNVGALVLIANNPSNSTFSLKGHKDYNTNDFLDIYDGESSEASRFNTLYDRDYSWRMYDTVSSTNIVKIVLHQCQRCSNDKRKTETGLDLVVNVRSPRNIVVKSVSNGSVVSDKSTARFADTVALNVSPNEGYVLSGITVKDDAGNILDVDFDWSSAKFVMPNSNINIYPVFTNSITAEDGFYLNMPAHYEGRKVFRESVLPEGIVSFKLYDDGGKDGGYSKNQGSSYLQLTASDGDYRFRITGSVQTRKSYDELTVFDGDQEATKLVDGINSPSELGEKTDVGTLVTSGNVVTFYFVTRSGNTAAGLDLKVELLFPITVINVSNGSMTSDKEIAASGETVTLTANFDEGYYPQGVSVVDANGNEVPTTEYAGFVYKFTMPNGGVTVTPSFALSPKVNIVKPENGSIEIAPNTVIVPGRSVILLPNADEGYYRKELTVIDDLTGETLSTSYEAGASTAYHVSARSFLMPNNSVTVSATYVPQPYVYVQDDPNGSVESDVTRATPNGKVSLTATPADGYLFMGVVLKDENDVKIKEISADNWFSMHTTYDVPNTAWFSMPNENDVYVAPVFKNAVTADDGTYLVMPRTGIKNVSVPAAIKSFKVYDHGGPNGAYSKDANGSVVFTAPKGYLLQVDILKIKTATASYGGAHDYLTVYDGNVNNFDDVNDVAQLLHKCGTSVGSALSSSNAITVNFMSDNNSASDGFELMVTLVYSPFVKVASIEGGFVEVDNELASAGETVTLTAIPAAGYLFGSLEVKDAEDNIVATEISGTTATFTMPATTVTVTPSWLKLYSVSVVAVDGGSVSSDKETTVSADTVTLTVTPATGYVLSNVAVVDADGTSVEVVGGKWHTGNQVKFAMPEKAVTVTPTFTNDLEDLYVNFPQGGDNLFAASNEGVFVPEAVSSFMVYDDGGKDGNHGSGISIMVIAAAKGTTLEMTGSVSLTKEDQFAVYDKTGNKLLFQNTDASVEGLDIGTLVADTLMVLFVGIGEAAGFELQVTVENPNAEHKITPVKVADGKVTPSVQKALPGDIVTLTATPSANYFVAGFEVKAGDRTIPVRGGDFIDRTATFEMPTRDVTVKPLFTQDLNGLFVNMPTSGTKTVAIPAGMESFNVYDDGGKDFNMGRNGEVELVLTPPEGTALQISGTVDLCRSYTRGVDSMAIVRVSDGKVLWASISDKRGQQFDVPELVSAGSVRIYLNTWTYASEGISDNIDLSVEVLDASATYYVDIADANGGEVKRVKNATTATAGEEVALTATPGEGFILSEIQVAGGKGKTVNVEGGAWYSNNAASFIMPASDVTVTSVFTDDWSAEGGLYVNLIDNGTKNVTIPAGVTSFKVYDDGGKDGNHSKSVSGDLILTAPEGYVMRLSGTMKTDEYGSLTVNDGSEYGDYKLISSAKSYGGTERDLGLVFSSGNVMRIGFVSYGGEGSEGLDLKVEVVKSSVIAYATVNGKNAAVINGNFLGTETVEITSETSVDTVIFQRKFSTSGYSTIMLPFDVNVKNLQGVNAVIEFNGMTEDSDGKDAVAMMYVWCSSEVQAALKSAAEQTDNPEKYEHCNDAGYSTGLLTAYKPYMIQMKSSNLGFNLKNVGATIKPTPTNVEATAEGCDWVFRGSLQKHVWTKDDKDMGKIWGFAAENQGEDFKIGHFYQFGPGAWIRPLRAYLYNPNGTLPTKKSQSAPIPKNVSLGDVASIDRDLPETLDVVIVSRGENGGEHTTVIGHINARTGEFRLNRGTRTFDLKGRSVGKPQAKGIYLRK